MSNIDNTFSFLKNEKSSKFQNIIISLIIITLSYAAAEYVYDLFESNKNKKVIYGQLSLSVYYLIIMFGLIASIDNLGFSKTALVTALGTIGLTLALSLQNLIASIIAGIYIGFKNLFKIGDYLEIVAPSGSSQKGTIVDVDLFVTTIYSEDKLYHIIPNTTIANNVINIKHLNQ